MKYILLLAAFLLAGCDALDLQPDPKLEGNPDNNCEVNENCEPRDNEQDDG